MLVVLFGCGSSSGKAYAIKATVSGLAGSGLELWVNGHDPVLVNADGEVTLIYMVSGYHYSVTVKTQPTSPAQTCTVANATGVVGSADVTDIAVTCVTTYAIGGTVSGLDGSGLVLHSSLGEDLPISADGTFVFPTRVVSGAEYVVTVKTQPTPNPPKTSETCSVGNAQGTVSSSDVLKVTVVCSTAAFQVGGTVSGLAANTSLILQNNGTDYLTVSTNGDFTFTTAVASGATYEVAVKTQPTNPWQTCTVTNGTGTIASAAITNVNVNCTINQYAVVVNVSGLSGTGLVLQNNGGDDLAITANGNSAFSTHLDSGATYAVTVKTQPSSPTQSCTVANGSGTVGGVDVTNVQVVCKGLWTSVAAGGNHSVAVKVDGTLWAWGGNYRGQLGDNSTTDKHVPVAVLNASGNTPLTGVTAVAAGYSHTCALVNGGVQCWGYNGDGELGNNSTTDSHLPVTVINTSGNAPLSGVSAIAAGYAHTCALTTEGGVYCWGNNGGGELGNNSNTRSLVPVVVLNPSGNAPLSGVTAISVGYHDSCALVYGGILCWGHNYYGELGNNSTTESHLPVAVLNSTGSAPLYGATNVAAGGGYACSLMSGGGVQCWGSNYLGRLGNNSTTDSHVAVQVTGMINGAIVITTGGGHTCALMSNGSVQCWGANENGQLGDDSTTESHTPIAVLNSSGNAYLNGVTAIATGGSHTCALLNGGVQCWGGNEYGQLGNNSTNSSSVPVPVQF